MKKLVFLFLVGMFLLLPDGLLSRPRAARRPTSADRDWVQIAPKDRDHAFSGSGMSTLDTSAGCDNDGDGFCFPPFGPDCDDNDPLTHPGAEERADLKDNNCNGFEDEPPVGFTRVGYSMQGFASAVEWYADYVYLAAGAVLQVYYAPPGSEPLLLREIEFRDWVREMAVDGDTLFVAARGDGLFAFDLAGDPAHPRLAGRVSGRFDAGDYADIEAVFNGVDARGGRVAVARANNVTKGQGGVDALVFDYDPASGSFTPVRVLGTEVRSNTALEVPVTVGLTEDGGGLYVGYGVLVGELVYVTIDSPGDPVLHKDIGAVMDIKTKGDAAFVAVTRVDWPWVDSSMLSRVRVVAGELVEEPVITNRGSSAGGTVDIHGDLLCFGTWSPARYEEGGYNLWAFTDLLADTPTRIGAAGTLDWIFQLACRDSDSGSDWIYVADEWGGFQLWESDGSGLTLDLDRHRVATGMFSLMMWNDGSNVYSVKEGGGLWVFDESEPHNERVAVEWIDRSDPGCSCEGCCPPQEGTRPYPPAVFVSAGTSSQGRVALLAQDRNTAVPGAGYFMLFEEDGAGGAYEAVYSEPVEAWSGNVVRSAGEELLFASTASHALRAYQHCPGESDPVRLLGEIETPAQDDGWEITDVAPYGDYLFVTEVHRVPLAVPDSGKIHAYRWKQGDLATCPNRPSLLSRPEYLGSFATDLIPYRLLVDPIRDRLVVGATSKPTFPVKEGGLLFYDLGHFDPGNPADMDNHRTDASPDESIRVTYPNIHGILLDGDSLYVADYDNGLYEYSLNEGAYVGFYPAHRGPMSQAYAPQLVQSPEGVVPLYHPVSVALTPSGKIAVQEHTTGRVSILSEPHTGAPWPTFGHDPQHTGRSPYNGPRNPVRLWAYAVPRGRMMNFAPSVDADGTVYVGTWGDIQDGNAPGKLYALRPDGSLKWVFDPGPPEQPSQNQHRIWGTIEASVAIAADGTLYFGRGDNKLYALHPDGSLKWIFATFPDGFPEQGGQVISSPTIGPDGTIYFGTVPYTEAGISALFAVNPDGTEKWHIEMGTTEGVWASPALGPDGTIYVGGHDGNFYAVEDRGQGDYRVRWTYRPAGSSVNWFGPASIGPDGTIYAPAVEVTGICTAVGKLYALADLGDSYDEKWAFTAPGPDEAAINVSIGADGTVYAGAASLNNHQSLCNKPDVGNLYALTDNGAGQPPTIRWTYAAGGGVSGTAIGADGTVYVAIRGDLKAGKPGQVFAVHRDGSPAWPAPYQAAGEIWWGTPVLGANGDLYFADAPCADIINTLPCKEAPALYALGDVANDDFLFGIGYTTGKLAAAFANTGARQAKRGYYTSWKDIEPDPPQDGVHSYRWDGLDKMVTEYQSYGFSEIHLTLQSKSSWGTEGGCNLLQCRSSLPRPEHWEDYEAYVRAVVERYDGDGVDDMPGLRYPVRQYEIETEADNWWPTPCPEDPQDPDRASTYLQLLTAARRAAREAYPDVQILPGAMLFYGLFSGDPDEATVAARRAAHATVDCITTFNEEVLRHPELFDAVEFHFLGDDYREIAATIRWLRGQMRANGYEKPIYPSDIPTAPALVPTAVYTETFLYPQEVVKGYLDIIKDNITSDTPSQEYLDIRAWYAGEQAEFTVKLLVSAMAEGAAGVQLAAMTDFPWLLLCTPTWWYNYYAIWNWGLHGMVEVDWGPFAGCFPMGYELGEPRPVFHTLRWLIARLQGFTSVERLSPASADDAVGLYAYRVVVDGRPVYVVWAEDGVGQVMGEIEPSVAVTLPVATTAVSVTHTITRTGQTDPRVEVVSAVDGAVHLTVDETPVFVEGDTLPCPLVGDFDCDGEVTVADIMAIVTHWNTRLGAPGYAADFDLDRDGDTDVVDVMWVATRWGLASRVAAQPR